MKITRMKRHPRRERVRIHVDGEDEVRFELALDLALREGLAPGVELEPARLEALEREDQGFRAREAALNLLSVRARSTAELRQRLQRKEFAAPVVEATMEFLAERGYLDDAEFARSFVRDRVRLRPRGRIGLLQELRRKGVAGPVAEAAVEAVMEAEDIDEAALARDAAEAWARRNRSAIRKGARSREDRLRLRNRLYAHLARRGFAPDAIRGALDGVLGD